MQIISHEEAMKSEFVSTRSLELDPILATLRTLQVGEVLKFPRTDWKFRNSPGSKISRYFASGAGKDLSYTFISLLTKDGFYMVERIK